MTNHWSDIDNASLIVVMGANPTENHPACMAHVNAARYGSKKARLVVIDPRKTRTAQQADLFVRIRPGTDIAFLNGVMNYIMSGVADGVLDPTFTTNFVAWHNGTNGSVHTSAARTFVDDQGTTRTLTQAELNGAKYDGVATTAFSGSRAWPKYCDSRALVDVGTFVDYKRAKLTTASYNAAVSTNAFAFSGVPQFSSSIFDADTVYSRLKSHVANYTLAESADICGCSQADIIAVAQEFIANSRMMSSDFSAATSTPAAATYKAGTVLYAMGQTQHTYGSQNIRGLAVLQTMLGNMGRPGGGINALRGIHNVQGSTDFAVLYDGIPGYSDNPGKSNPAETYPAYADNLFGNRVVGTGAGDPYEPRKLGLQQRGFYNMTTQWFGKPASGSSTVASYTVEGAKSANLANGLVNAGSVVVWSGALGTGTFYKEGVDYTVSYGSASAVGSISRVAYKAIPDAGTVFVSYTYGATQTVVTDESVTFAASAATAKSTVALAKIPDAASVVVTGYSAPGDYTVNYATGVLTWVDGGTIPYAGTVTVNYTTGGGTPVTNESKTFAKGSFTLKDSWLKSGTITVTGSGPTTLVEGTDYSVDYSGGVVTRLEPGAITDAMTFTATYDKWTARAQAEFDSLYALWPKGDGVNHITAFRAMGPTYAGADAIKAAVVWGQNPAVTEPNQSFVRDGLENLDLLVCVDIFENETAAAKRKATGVTYLLPACSHVEEAGSVTNSGRWLQWRDRARAPYGNSKADLELLLRLAKKLDGAGAFNHIKSQWTANNPDLAADLVAGKSAWDVLYGKHCSGWDGVSATGFEALTYSDADRKFPDATPYGTVYGSEAAAESIFEEIARPLDDGTVGSGGGGTMWIYSGAGVASAYNASKTNVQPTISGYNGTVGAAWSTLNRAKSRDSSFAGVANNFPRYGWAWLLNRRVFYNNSEVANDVADVFVAPGVIARMMTFRNNNTNAHADFSLLYRKYNSVKDMPSKTGAGTPHAAGLPGNFPAYTEPIETPRRDLAAKYGRNTSANAALVKSDSRVALWSSAEVDALAVPLYSDPVYTGATGSWNKDAKDYPLVLTTIRCVEHFQGGPITRNNSWNVEAEPVPWIEINSADARTYGIKDGDWVNVVTPRSNSFGQQEGRTNKTGWAKGFKARVGVGLSGNQRVAPGVVAIPWHWGDQGLSTGSRANDLCIDAYDANTIIPEYKACLCRISTNTSDVPAL